MRGAEYKHLCLYYSISVSRHILQMSPAAPRAVALKLLRSYMLKDSYLKNPTFLDSLSRYSSRPS